MAVAFGSFFAFVVSALVGFIMLSILSSSTSSGQSVNVSISTAIASLEAVVLTFIILIRPVCWCFDAIFDFEYRHRRNRDDARNAVNTGNYTGREMPVEEVE